MAIVGDSPASPESSARLVGTSARNPGAVAHISLGPLSRKKGESAHRADALRVVRLCDEPARTPNPFTRGRQPGRALPLALLDRRAAAAAPKLTRSVSQHQESRRRLPLLAIRRALVPLGGALCFVLAAVQLDGGRGGTSRVGPYTGFVKMSGGGHSRVYCCRRCAGKTGRLACSRPLGGPLARSHTHLFVRSRGRRECVAASCVCRRVDGWWRRLVFGSDRDEAEGRT